MRQQRGDVGGRHSGQRRQTEGRSFLQKRRNAFGGRFWGVCFAAFFGLIPFGNMTEDCDRFREL
jgi:hypothetical protein